MDLNAYHMFHFIGIGGMGMRALAKILLDKGIKISGSDVVDSLATQQFREQGVPIYIGHKKENINQADVVIISSAISSDNPELIEARDKGIPVFHRSDVLAAVLEWGKAISIAGAHGKSTTSAMIGQIFYESGLDPTIVLGGATDYLHGNSRLGKGKYVIAEADESDGSFLKFSSFISVVTNIEDDHLDHYGTVENIRKAFVKFIEHIAYDSGVAILCTDSLGIRMILPDIHKKIITFGLDGDVNYKAVNKRYENHHMLFDVYHEQECLGTITLQIPGTHNIRDALGAIVTALYCGISFKTIQEALKKFNGVERRFQTKLNSDIWIVDDYAHHPSEIEATLEAAKESGQHRVICAFQPHRYSRTKLLKDEFAVAFAKADVLFLTDIYAAGESPLPGGNGRTIEEAVKKVSSEKEIYYIEDLENLPSALYDYVHKGDMVITMGAGNIYKVGENLKKIIEEKGLASD